MNGSGFSNDSAAAEYSGWKLDHGQFYFSFSSFITCHVFDIDNKMLLEMAGQLKTNNQCLG